MSAFQELKIFSGSANKSLSESIVKNIGVPLGNAQLKRFSDGEVFVEIDENVRGMDVFVIQSTCAPANENLMELLIMVDALKRASADRITAVIPYYGYARQDRKVQPRTPITSKLVADMLTAAGVQRVLSMDLHAGQIQGFFNIPFDHLYATPIFLDYLAKEKKGKDWVVVSPDAGGTERARAYAKRLNAELAIIDKRRSAPNHSEVMHLVGEVKGRKAIIVDDIVDTAGTLAQGAKAIMDQGATEVIAVSTHGVLSGSAVEKIERSPLGQLLVSDTIPLGDAAKKCQKIKVLSVGKILSEAIRRIHTGESVSSLFV